jgi:hypothetical protein
MKGWHIACGVAVVGTVMVLYDWPDSSVPLELRHDQSTAMVGFLLIQGAAAYGVWRALRWAALRSFRALRIATFYLGAAWRGRF